jgi:hypothetical protein
VTGRARRAAGLALALLLAAAPAPPALAQGRPVAKVSVAQDGAIALDGRAVTLGELRDALRELAAWKGEVWYWRANPTEDPPPAALDVMQAILDARLPVRFATKPDFSAFDAPSGADGGAP